MSVKQPLYLGIDIGGTSVKAGLVDDEGTVWARTRAPLDLAAGLDAGLVTVFQAVDQLFDERLQLRDVQAVGVASPGTMDIPAGIVFHPFNLPGWENLPLRDIIGDRLEKPAALQNDANAAAFGEYWVGAASDAGSLLFWTLGTGIGGGIVINGQLLEGAHSHAGECGHMVLQTDGGRPSQFGMHGSLECYAGGKALVQRAREALAAGRPTLLHELATGDDSLTPRLIADAAERGDGLAMELVLDTARYLGVGTASLMNILDPEIVLIGGAMTFGGAESELGRRFLGRVREEVQARAFPIPAARTRIEFARLGNNAGFIGAAACARQQFPAIGTEDAARDRRFVRAPHLWRGTRKARAGA
jgi:glucokinase